MHGVAALLCRLGLRPHSACALSTRIVADFMGVLNYVSTMISPAIHRSLSWRSAPHICGTSLRKTQIRRELRHWRGIFYHFFQKMIMKRVVDVGNVGEVAACIFLLLAMDAAMMKASTRSAFIFARQFCTVNEFLDILSGSPRNVVRNNMSNDVENRDKHRVWMEKWNTWTVGFCQFQDLPDEPTEETLWQLLSRRAAGVFHPMQSGPQLIIPIFSGSAVSFILVYVNNQEKDYPFSGFSKLLPSNVFHHSNSKTQPCAMIPVYTSLREDNKDNSAQMYMDTAEMIKKASGRRRARRRSLRDTR
ncbi:hypothetical protein GQ600_13067 [Phytophthora cactorum]|nr:hypothetical protein GQ600_13067 [Phytophthora cactorum]